MFTVLIQTLGCKLNQLESEAVADVFCKSGFSLYKTSGASPSVIVINTCTVTSKADQKARRIIRKALRDYTESCVLVTGCYAELNRDDLLKLDDAKEQRLFVVNKENILKLPEYFNNLRRSHAEVQRNAEKKNLDSPCLSEKSSRTPLRFSAISADLLVSVKNLPDLPEDKTDVFQFNPERFSVHTRGFLKIQDGCDKHCTYCRIRLARGTSVSLDAQTALERLRILEKSYGEAVLTGVNICQYRDENSAPNLARLLEYLLSGTKKIALRLSSLVPESVDEELAKVLSDKRIRPHFHLSIQSGSEKVLEKMGRSYNVQTVEKAATLLRRAKDDPFLACDIITGFPSETETQFNETYNLCQKTDFAWIHVFPYSKRPGTAAWSFPWAVQEKEVTRRARLLTDLARQGRAGYVRRWLDREVDVLIENSDGAFCCGISENYLKLIVQYNGEKAPLPSTVLRCKLLEKSQTEKTEDYDAIAEILNFH